MKNRSEEDLSFDEFDELNFPRSEGVEFDAVMESALSRRAFVSGGLVIGTATFVMGGVGACSMADGERDELFAAIDANTRDTVTVPKGFSWHIVAKWGDPMWSDVPVFDEETRGSGRSQQRAFGDNNDGMELFNKSGKSVLVVNNEFVNLRIMFGANSSLKPETDDDVLKCMTAHGVSIVEIEEQDERWRIVKDAPLNRRITPMTPIEITGPAKGHPLMRTGDDPVGQIALGTWNNCGSGRTPWGTFLTCEENFNGYFSSSDRGIKPDKFKYRYGIGARDRGYGWAAIEERFDISKHPNESNRFGYVVEIDPFDPNSTPKKRTALGRFKHENAEVVIASSRQVVVYLGDDERGEFLYKYISDGKYSGSDIDPMDASKLLDEGTLYAAKFNDDYTGEWLPLTPDTIAMQSKAEICIHTRLAGSLAGATTMDRPEWVAVNPHRAEVYCALTNNKNRGVRKKDKDGKPQRDGALKTNRGGEEMVLSGPNPRPANKFGQIVRLEPEDGDHASLKFKWDLFVLAGNPLLYEGALAGSANINAGNMFNSPDGIVFDSEGRLWIQTDGKYSNKDEFKGMGNNQMLVGDPKTGEINRFLVGPRECEVTGLTWSRDRRTMFVGIQHPGYGGRGHFPNGWTSLPRSCVIAVKRDDGGEIG